jgi:hypothetical protein
MENLWKDYHSMSSYVTWLIRDKRPKTRKVREGVCLCNFTRACDFITGSSNLVTVPTLFRSQPSVTNNTFKARIA